MVYPSIHADDMSYKYCNQDMLAHFFSDFPALPQKQPVGDEWMTSDQESVATLFGWTSVGVSIVIIILLIWRLYYGWVKPFFLKSYEVGMKLRVRLIASLLLTHHLQSMVFISHHIYVLSK